jgi:hypothetical protein
MGQKCYGCLPHLTASGSGLRSPPKPAISQDEEQDLIATLRQIINEEGGL